MKSSTRTARFVCASAAVKPLCGQLTRITASTVASRIVNANEQGNGRSGKGIRIRLLNSSNLQKRKRGADSCDNIGNNNKKNTFYNTTEGSCDMTMIFSQYLENFMFL